MFASEYGDLDYCNLNSPGLPNNFFKVICLRVRRRGSGTRHVHAQVKRYDYAYIKHV